MDIYEEITMFTKPNITKEGRMTELIREWEQYRGEIDNNLERFLCSDSITYEREEISPSLLQNQNKEDFEKLCHQKTTPTDCNLLIIDSINIYAKREIDDGLSSEDLMEEIKFFHDEITDEIQEIFKNNGFYDYIYEDKPIELEKLPNWAIDNFYSKYDDSLKIFENVGNQTTMKVLKHIRNKDFTLALETLTDEKLSSENLIKFMGEVVKAHDANKGVINSAIKDVAEYKDFSQEYGALLLKTTLNSDEYKKALDKEQGKTQTNDKTY